MMLCELNEFLVFAIAFGLFLAGFSAVEFFKNKTNQRR
jgi:hypothetical protein